MVYMKYLLGKTGWFPKLEPNVEDVLIASDMVYAVKNVVTPHKGRYYYVIPTNYRIRYLYDLLRIFRANGVWLQPHKSKNYHARVFRVRDKGQIFMRDVMRVCQDYDNFQKVLAERNVQMPSQSFQDLLKKLEQRDR